MNIILQYNTSLKNPAHNGEFVSLSFSEIFPEDLTIFSHKTIWYASPILSTFDVEIKRSYFSIY